MAGHDTPTTEDCPTKHQQDSNNAENATELLHEFWSIFQGQNALWDCADTDRSLGTSLGDGDL